LPNFGNTDVAIAKLRDDTTLKLIGTTKQNGVAGDFREVCVSNIDTSQCASGLIPGKNYDTNLNLLCKQTCAKYLGTACSNNMLLIPLCKECQ